MAQADDEELEPLREEREGAQRAGVLERGAKDADRRQAHAASETDVDDHGEDRRSQPPAAGGPGPQGGGYAKRSQITGPEGLNKT